MFKFIFVLLIAGYAHFTNAVTEAELKGEFTKLVMKCMKVHSVEINELLDMQKFVPPKSQEAKCLLACAYKLDGVMTQDGKYNLDHAYKVAERLKNGDEGRLERAKKMSDICSTVNEKEVSDGDKGCERAALMFKCTVENAPKFGFKL